MNKAWREDFAVFLEEPSREGLRSLLRDHLGETNGCDFKKAWPTYPKLSRHILALANSGGGCLIIGVEEKADKTFEPVGLDEIIDKGDIHKSIEKFIPAQLLYVVMDFFFQESEYPKIRGRRFQVLVVEDTPNYLPFVAKSDGDGIRKNAIYIRHFTNSQEANYEQLQAMLNLRIETEYSTRGEFDLQHHMDQLKALYSYISPMIKYYHYDDTEEEEPEEYPRCSIGGNPNYPRERFDEYVKKLIEKKKSFIQAMITS